MLHYASIYTLIIYFSKVWKFYELLFFFHSSKRQVVEEEVNNDDNIGNFSGFSRRRRSTLT